MMEGLLVIWRYCYCYEIMLGLWYVLLCLQNLDPPLDVWMYTPDTPKIDPNMALMYVISLAAIIIGAYWSGKTRHAV